MYLKTLNVDPTFETLQEEGVFRGYASVFHTLDANEDIVLPGCFQHAIDAFHNQGTVPKMLWQHDPHYPIGKWTHLEEDAHGLYVTGKLFLNLPKAQETYLLMKEQELKGLSIGYHILKSRPHGSSPATLLEKVSLLEISLVTFPANSQAQVVECKQDNGSYLSLQERLHALIQVLEHP